MRPFSVVVNNVAVRDDSDSTAVRRRHRAEVFARLPVLVDRLGWSAERLAVWREQQLRAVLHAALDAPWHRRRLADIDVDAVTVDGLATLPVMSKAEMMEHLDEALTAPGITRAILDAHLLQAEDSPYLFDRYRVLASGGSSGVRGLYVFDWDAWADYCGGLMRPRVARRDANSADVVARVSADKSWHATAAVPATVDDPERPSPRFPVTRPLPEIIAGLNGCQPTVLMGYPSALAELAAEADAGRLTIAPRLVVAHSEPLLPEVRRTLEAAWDVRVDNSYGTSEGPCAYSCPNGRGMHLADDLAIIELVDDQGDPVPPGCTSAKVYVTNLCNRTQPFIRYELSDQLTRIAGDCGCGTVHTWIAEPVGRQDDVFVYPDGTRIHPLVFRSPLGRTAAIVEYQVLQTPTGANLLIIAEDSVSTDEIAHELTDALRAAGLAHPTVAVHVVTRLDRLPSGKVRRFITDDKH